MHSFLDWIEAARYRWKLVAISAALAFLAALIYLALTPRTYSAQASLIVDTQQPDPVEGETAGGSNRAVMTTQADLIRTPRVAAEAAVAAGLDKDPAYIAEWRSQTGGRSPYAEWLKRRMLGSLAVEPGKDTNILVITTTAGDPAEAARLANGFAKAAVSSRYRLRTEPAKAYANWLENQMNGARAKVLERQNALSNFVRQTGLSQGEDLSSQGSQLASVSGQLATAEAAAAAARQSAYADAQSRGDAENSSTVQRLRGEVAQKSARLSELEAVFGPDYPDVQRVRAELGTLNSSLNTELSRAQSTFSSSRNAQAAAQRQAAVATESRLRSLAAQERAKLESLGVNVAQYTTLRNEFTAAQANYNNLNQRLSTMRLQSAVPQTEVQVLDQASRFLVSSLPNRSMTLTLAILVGLVLGTILAIILEFLNPRVRSWGGVERLLGVQVIGRVALPRQGPAALGAPAGPRLLQGAA